MKILLIEDNPGDVRLIKELLKNNTGHPFQMEEVGCLSLGLERLKQGGIDVILLDLSLPDSKGLDSFVIINKQFPHIPIVVLTGLDDDAVALKAVSSGAQDYLVKGSVDGNLLSRTLRYAIERKQVEDDILTFKLGIEHSHDVIFITDIQGIFTYTNPAFEKFYGFTRQEVLGKTPRILKSGQHPQEYYKQFWETLLSNQEFKGEFINKTKEGKTVYMEVTVDPIINACNNSLGFIAIQRDISARKKAEEGLKLFRTLINQSNDSIESVNPRSG